MLVLSHLQSHGYIETATALLNESRSTDSLSHYDVADNIDLLQILKEWEEYYRVRFNRKPVFCKQNRGESGSSVFEAASRKHASSKRRSTSNRDRGRISSDHTTLLPPLSSNQAPPSTTKPLRSRKRTFPDDEKQSSSSDADHGGVTGFSLNSPTKRANDSHAQEEPDPRQAFLPPPNFEHDPELQSLALTIRRDIVQKCRVPWSEVVGLDDAKRLLKEAIILPRKYPALFTGLRSPWKSVLLYGSPGTGKTLLAQAVATESNTTFFNISASSIVSKFRGESEKLVRMLFDLARHYSPSTIFIDEVDSIMYHRGSSGSSASEGSEHEGSRRMKTELLVQMDGLLASTNNGDVFVLAASNLPWDLDSAFLRRMEKRVLIPLPTNECRKEMIRCHLSEFSPAFRKGELLDGAASQLEGYSCSEIKTICREAAMKPIRRILQHVEVIDGDRDLSILMKRNPVTAQDFREAIASNNNATSTELCQRYMKWAESHGAV